MNKYKVEGGINFYEELFKSLDDDSDNEDTLCQITGFPLKNHFVTLECNHKFNYKPLYKEIYRQKFHFKTYDLYSLTKKDLMNYKLSKVDYYIKCPYCRSIQFSILPYYDDMGLAPIYGINSLDPSLPGKIEGVNNNSIPLYSGVYYGHDDFVFNMFGVSFKKGTCSNNIGDCPCKSKYVSQILNTDLYYCKYHYKKGLRDYKLAEKTKQMELKKKEKEEMMDMRKKLFEEKNAERLKNGLPPLKRLVMKKKVENEVQPLISIGEYIPEPSELNDLNNIIVCKSILKTGKNKGQQCGCKKIESNGLCKRHLALNS